MAELRDMNQMSDRTSAREWLYEVSIAVDETTQRFLESTQGLRSVLEIFDPVLATTVAGLEANKFSFLLLAAQGFERLENHESPEIKYTYPGDRAERFDLAQTYQWYSDRYPLDPTQPTEWPDDVLLSFVAANPDIGSDRLVLSEPDSLLRLAGLVEEHLRSLSAARESLAAFLRERFNLEDLLALQTPVSRYDRIHAMRRMSNAVSTSYVRWFAGKPVRKFQTRAKDTGQEKDDR